MAIAGKVGAVYVSDPAAAPIPFTNEPTTPDAARRRYQVSDPAYRYWRPDEAVTVRVNGAVVTSGFTLEHAGGVVVFDSPLGPDDEVTVSGVAVVVEQAGGFFNWSIDPDSEDLDATTFESGGWREFKAGLLQWSGSAEAYWGDARFAAALGELIVVKLFIDAGPSQDCFEGWALLKGDSIEVPVDGLVERTIEFTGVGPLYPRF